MKSPCPRIEHLETSGGQGNQMGNGARTGHRRGRIRAGLAAVVAAALLGASGFNAPGAGADPTDPAQPPPPATVEAVPASEGG